jgi:DNA polymerase III delta subunit
MVDWRDAVLNGEAGRAARLTGPLLDQSGVTAVKMVTLLGTSLLGIGLARGHYDRRTRGGPLAGLLFARIRELRLYGLPDWKEESSRWARWAEAWPSPRIRAALQAARDADQALKSTTVSDERGILVDLVLRLTVEHQVAA